MTVHRVDDSAHKTPKRRRRRRLTVRGALARTYSARDLEWIVDQLVLRRIASQDYNAAIDWVVHWSHHPWVLRHVYGSRHSLFKEWLHGLLGDEHQTSELFAMNVLANLVPRQRLRAKPASQGTIRPKQARLMRHRFWRSQADLLAATPLGQLPGFVQLGGEQHLVEAHRRGRGVIIVSMHGLPGPAQLHAIETYLRLDDITTISWRTPRRQSRYAARDATIPGDLADSMNAELALFSARQLQAGRILQILGDSPDRHGPTFGVQIAGRLVQLKAGFAELSLTAGAAVLPHWRYCLPSGVIRYEFGPAFETEGADRGMQVEALVQQYARFIEDTWTSHPESVTWDIMRKHLRHPPGGMAASPLS